jgi:rhamnosyltransferase
MVPIKSEKVKINPKIVAVYWVFNPDIKILTLSLKNLVSEVSEIIILDNGSKNIDELRKLVSKLYPYKIEVVELKKNLGVKALNIGISRAIEKGADWVLLMDDDSIYPASALKEIIRAYNVLCRYKNDVCNKIGVISLPTWMNRETKSIFKTYHYTWQFSGSLIKVDVIKKHNLSINEEFFVDIADLEFFGKIHSLGYITIHFMHGMLIHKSGRKIQLPYILKPWKKRIWTSYTPWRYYMRVRNSIAVLRQGYWDPYNALRDLFLSGLVLTIMYGFRTFIRTFTLGVAHGLFGKLGYLDPKLLQSEER